ncbi:uncharacterized protein LOC127789167 [Diospyros lotus]|uniref:uncharacterized protein LOC127789167 n=1 Tax=Diospyros lotus TaxID=55363 RepID=UPI00224DDA7C|nr:uncharacterized protein LOC127789167 [Diospyros lotus]XP_052173935.1 uncharacterized protein LOC127789167 [Diospyros lotus]XP_052173937.1 uncharacterized protein LOC127789167 [Diospyros lotus]
MNFLLRPAQTAPPPVTEQPSSLSGTDGIYVTKHVTTLEGLIAEDPFSQSHAGEVRGGDADGNGGENGSGEGTRSKDDLPVVENYIDVAEDEGCIIIPDKNLPDNWSEASDMGSFRSLDRHFLFPGEQVHMLACLSAYKQDIEIITPFKVAALMSKNGIGKNTKKQNGNVGYEIDAASESGEVSPISHDVDQDSDNLSEKIDPQKDISSGESLLRMEDRKRQTERLLRKFENSHFFVRISESDEPLWSKRSSPEESFESSLKKGGSLNAIIDRGNFDASVSGGLARNAINCCSLPNGDILVLLQVNVGVDFMRDPILEILQFEKYQDRKLSYESLHNSDCASKDPCGDLLKWLLPLDNSIAPPSRPVSPPTLSSNSSIRSTSTKPNFSASSGSQLFSFGHFRSYSMSSLPPNTVAPAPVPVATPSSKPNIDLEDWDQFASQKVIKSQKPGSEGLLSFRGVSLEPDRFSVRCGLEGIYRPGRRWRRKIEIIQPIEIRSFAADCNADDILCVQIKNVSPANAPDIVIYLDAITVVFEEVSKGGPPISLPFACIEPGDGHSLPNLALRRGEEHSFILKPATLTWKNTKGPRDRVSQSSHSQAGSNLSLPANTLGGKQNASTSDLYAILVSCRSNYTESKMFFKQTTSWQPRILRDLMISVASEMSGQNFSPHGRTQLPVQVLTLQASNLTSEDLTLTVLAPASFTSPPSVVSLNSSPTSPVSPFISHSESVLPVNGERRSSAMESTSSASPAFINQRENADAGLWSVSFCEQISDVLPSTDSGCTHLWLQSRVPLGSVPAQSTATVKLEVLPLTDGIITLDSLQINVKEKGMTYIPEHSLKINATSSIATGIF